MTFTCQTLSMLDKLLSAKCADIISPPGPGSVPGPLPSWICLGHLLREAPKRHPNHMPEPPQLAPFHTKEQRKTSHPEETNHPPGETHGFRFRGADPHEGCFTLSCRPIQRVLKVTDHQDHPGHLTPPSYNEVRPLAEPSFSNPLEQTFP